MNYSITEDRLKQVIDKFISEHVGILTKHFKTGSDYNYYWWENKDGEPVFYVAMGGEDEGMLGVYSRIWFLVKDLFNLNSKETDNSFLRWAYHHMGFELENGVYIFDN